jgi:hypothetical protein
MPGSAVHGARAMQCQHPPEERQPVYEGTAVARTDRTFCGLCGHVLYVSDSNADRGLTGPFANSRRDAGDAGGLPALQPPDDEP